jgi:O-succinylbenzoic acid--CoA ligase
VASLSDVDVRRHLRVTGPGDLVAVALPPGPRWLPLLEELWASGAAVLPLDPRLRPAELRAALDRARPGLVLDADGATVRTDAQRVSANIAIVLATSGTAGTPKVVELSQPAVEAALRGSAAALGSEPNGSWLCCLPVAHVGGLLVLLRALVAGARVEVHAGFDPAAVAAADVDHVSLVPTMLHRLLESGADLARFHSILVGGAGLTDATAEAARAAGARVVTTYGLTESCGGIAYDGRLFEATAARLGPEDEVQLAGPTLMRGYLGDPGATAAAFTLDGWLRTGDAGAIADDGRLSVRGRLDERIRTGAETVWPQEVESALREHRKVAEVAVGGRPDLEWGQHVVAFVVPALVDEPPTLEELRDHAAERIARFKAPRELVLVPALPRTASGKIRRADLH